MSELNNLLWPFPIHNGERTEASKQILKVLKSRNDSKENLEGVLYFDPVTNTFSEEEALI